MEQNFSLLILSLQLSIAAILPFLHPFKSWKSIIHLLGLITLNIGGVFVVSKGNEATISSIISSFEIITVGILLILQLNRQKDYYQRLLFVYIFIVILQVFSIFSTDLISGGVCSNSLLSCYGHFIASSLLIIHAIMTIVCNDNDRELGSLVLTLIGGLFIIAPSKYTHPMKEHFIIGVLLLVWSMIQKSSGNQFTSRGLLTILGFVFLMHTQHTRSLAFIHWLSGLFLLFSSIIPRESSKNDLDEKTRILLRSICITCSGFLLASAAFVTDINMIEIIIWNTVFSMIVISSTHYYNNCIINEAQVKTVSV
jgi:hypothetical protein